MDLRTLLDDLASEAPAPGGGSASALTGSLAAALGAMVWRLAAAKGSSPLPAEQVAAFIGALDGLRGELLSFFERDADAYRGILAAYRLPKGTDAERVARAEAVQKATRGATDVPLAVARSCAEALNLCAGALKDGHPTAAVDAGVGILLAHAGLQGSLYNVEANLGGLPDDAYRRQTTAEVATLRAAAEVIAQKADEEVRRRSGG